MAEDQFLRNEKGQISMMPLIDWNTTLFDYGMMLQLRFAETPQELAEGILGVVQLAVSAEQALQIANELTNRANRILEVQATQLKKTPQEITSR